MNNNNGAIPRDRRNSVPVDLGFARTPTRTSGSSFLKKRSLSSSMKKICNKITIALDKLHLSFSESRIDEKSLSTPPKSVKCRNTIEKILSSGGCKKVESRSASILKKSKKLLQKFMDSTERDDVQSKISSSNSLMSLTELEDHLESSKPMDTASGRIIMYDDVDDEIVAVPFANFVYQDDMECDDEDDYLENQHFSVYQSQRLRNPVSQKWCEEESEDSSQLEEGCIIGGNMSGLKCLYDSESSVSRSSCSTVVHPSWTDEEVEEEEGEYVFLNRKCSCAKEEDAEDEEFILAKGSSDQEEDGFLMVENKDKLMKKNNSFVLTMYV